MLIVTEFVTLDGVGQGPGRPDEDRSGGFEFGGWQAPYSDRGAGETIFEEASSMDALLLGRRTYDIFADYWPAASDTIPFAALLNRIPKYVVSSTLAEPLVWNAATRLSGDLVAQVTALKERHHEVQVIGSLELVRSLLRLGLVDRLNLWLYPVVLGTGKRLFADGAAPTTLRLTNSTTYPSGTLHVTYETTGTPIRHTEG